MMSKEQIKAARRLDMIVWQLAANLTKEAHGDLENTGFSSEADLLEGGRMLRAALPHHHGWDDGGWT